MKIGKEKYFGLNRWYITIDNITTKYYDKYEFFRELSKKVNEMKLGKEEALKINKVLKRIM